MQTINEQQYDSLITKIYDLLMSSDDMGMGEMGDCSIAATELVNDWMEENKIVLA